jgi:hypothetical protein
MVDVSRAGTRRVVKHGQFHQSRNFDTFESFLLPILLSTMAQHVLLILVSGKVWGQGMEE